MKILKTNIKIFFIICLTVCLISLDMCECHIYLIFDTFDMLVKNNTITLSDTWLKLKV